jgi:hypothetical protein
LERSPLAVGEGTWSVFAQKVVKERDGARAEADRLRAALAERQDSEKDVVEPIFIFRGGFVQGQDGSRWWNENLLKRVETERDEARAKAEHVQLQLEAALDRSKDGAWMARALDAERELAEAKKAAIAAARGMR